MSANRPALLGTDSPAFAEAFRAARKQWPAVVVLVLLGIGVALSYTRVARKVFEAHALVEMNAEVMRPLGDKADNGMAAGGAFWDNQEYYETQYKIVLSQRVLRQVVRDLNLVHDMDFASRQRPSVEALEDDAVAALRDRTKVDPVKNSRLFYLRVEDTDPDRARRLCSAIATTYVAQNLETAVDASSDAVVWLTGQFDHVRHDLEQDENALYEFKKANDLPSTSINEASNMLRVEMQELDTSLTHTRTKRAELAARYAELKKVSSDNPDELPASELLANQFLQSLRSQYQQAVKDYDSLRASGKGDGHPLVKEAAERVGDTKRSLLAEVRNVQGAAQRDLAVIEREEASENDLFDGARRRAVELNMKEIEYHRLDRAREQNEKVFSLLLERMKEADLARMMKINNVRVVDAPTEPEVPIRPRATVNLTIGAVFGLALGLLFAWTREQLDSSIKTPEDLEQKLDVAFLGLLPEFDTEAEAAREDGRPKRRRPRTNNGPADISELVVHDRPLSGIAEAARSIRTNLMFMNPDRPTRRLLVTSAAPSEGKTTIACSVAIAFAQGGQRVCIVDCDLRRPRLHRIFDRSGDAGVTNVLVGDAGLDDVAKPTVVPNLWSIPAGPLPHNPADILHSEKFKNFLRDLSEKFDRVVIDSPPIAAVTDSAIISTSVDAALFVVRAFKTSKHLSSRGLRALRDVDAPVVGAVLNAVNLNRRGYDYYYQYYNYKRDGYRASPGEDGGAHEGTTSAPN